MKRKTPNHRTVPPVLDAGDQLLRPTQAAQLLNISARSLQNWRLAGEGPRYIKLTDFAIRYRRSDLERWLEDRAA